MLIKRGVQLTLEQRECTPTPHMVEKPHITLTPQKLYNTLLLTRSLTDNIVYTYFACYIYYIFILIIK